MVFAPLPAAALGADPDSLPAIRGYELEAHGNSRLVTHDGVDVPLINPEDRPRTDDRDRTS